MQTDDKPTHVIRRVAHAGLAFALAFTATLCLAEPSKQTAPHFAELDDPTSVSGYLARLLINETSFPGERAYVSETDSKGSMLAVLWVLHGRIQHIPPGYRQSQIAGVSSTNIIDVITGGGGKRQCEGFYRDAAGGKLFTSTVYVEEGGNPRFTSG